MATIIGTLIEGYHYMNVEIADPRTQNWFLVGSIWPLFGLIIFYIYFVKTLGPRLMSDREPFNLDRVMQIYNVVQILTSAYLLYKFSLENFVYVGVTIASHASTAFYPKLNGVSPVNGYQAALTLAWLKDYNIHCEPVDYSNSPKAIEIAATVWIYFIVKIIDLLDTVFFVMRKKYNQISFLHVYHHAGMVFGSWCGVKYLAGGHATFLGLINSFVHVVMYGYYFATSLKISRPWWKKYITQIQLLQFFLILLHFVQLFWTPDCGFPVWPALIFVPQNIFMIVLFGDFYYKSYIKKKFVKNVEHNGISNGKNFDEKSF